MGQVNSVRDPDISQIQTYLSSRKQNYLQVLNKIKQKLVEYSQYDVFGKRALYRVASRGDYQFGDELKTAQSIYKKIQEKRREGDSSYRVDNVNDVIGLRLVCVYPSDVQLVLNFLTGLHDSRFFGYYEVMPEERDTGYRAYHIDVALSDVDLIDYKCEIQVVTMLEETWSYKTHDLIYKPKEAITKEQGEQARLLSDLLHAIDEQCQLLERQIKGSIEEENQRKEGARLALISSLAKVDNVSKKALCEIRDGIMQDKEKLHCGDTTDTLQKLVKYMHDSGIDLDVCRVVMLLCTLRESDDLDQFAIDHVEKLIRKLEDEGNQVELCDAYQSAGLFFYCLGMPFEAIERTKKALEISGSSNSLESSRLRSNIAYFIADGNIQEEKDLAIKYAQEAYKNHPKDLPVLDTLGYVEITFGKTSDEVRNGLQKCEKVYEADPDKALATPYFHLHSKRAYKRLLELP